MTGVQTCALPILDQCIFRWFPCWPHQNFRISCSMLLHSVMGSLKQLTAKVGIACTTAFNNTSRPTWERSCSFHLAAWPKLFLWWTWGWPFCFDPLGSAGRGIFHTVWPLGPQGNWWSNQWISVKLTCWRKVKYLICLIAYQKLFRNYSRDLESCDIPL